ncbi:tol-pal system protein YbgF [Flaviflagellibacter deserti]|uniref:Cell division coordinator CpoB n=1 Tax=Flaviflagellibacter deserti TaxID=2267266 RepID=A0ABV9YWB0_9HYPH
MIRARSLLLAAGIAGFSFVLPQGSFAQNASDMSLRINRLEEQVRQLTGRNEEYQFQIRQLQDQVKALQGGPGVPGRAQAGQPPRQTDARPPQQPLGPPAGTRPSAGVQMGAADPSQPAPGPQNLGQLPTGPTGGPVTGQPGPLAQEPGAPMVLAPDFQPGGAPQQPPAGPGGGPGGSIASLTASGSPDEEYSLGAGFLQRKDYEFAETQFRSFLQTFPNDKRVPDALYGLGESYYQRNQHNDAIEPYLKVVTDYPQASRAADSMLRLGQTLGAINQKEQACATLMELGRKYPRSGAKGQSDREMQKLGC